MKNIKIIEEVDFLFKELIKTDSLLYEKYSNDFYYSNFSGLFDNFHTTLQNSLFKLITGESDYHDFYDRFSSPGYPQEDKPIAWDVLFIPDRIGEALTSLDISTKQKIKNVKFLYDKCVKIEKDFKKCNK